MSNPSDADFHCEVETAMDGTVKVTTVHCHGRLVSATGAQVKEVVKPLIPQGGVIVIDLKDVAYLDSMGLGTLVGLKVSALNEGYCTLKLENLAPRVTELLRLTNLTSLFSS